MTEVKTTRRGRPDLAREIAREMAEQELEWASGLPCFVHHADAGGRCERAATMLVYGLPLCEVHGTEARIGALQELYHDASDVLERVDNPHVPLQNKEAARVLEGAMEGFTAKCRELADTENEALLRAYPIIPERMCTETKHYDYGVVNDDLYPEDYFGEARHEVHWFMRQAYEKDMDWLVEVLEYERESISAQAAFAISDRRQRAGRDGGSE